MRAVIAPLLLGIVFFASTVCAQDDSGPPKPPPTFIELTSVQPSKKKDVWQ